MKCPKCQTENPETRKFCSECGAKLLLICPQCGFENLPKDKFCGECGQKLEEAIPGRKELSTEEERKQVTVLFSDLSEYTAMSERLDPEEVKQIMGQIFGEITSTVNKYDGTIEKFIGDAVVAFFGVPKVHEDDPVRAIRTAIEIHEIVDGISPQFESKVGKRLAMHTGVNTGLIVTGEVAMEKGTLGVTGDAVNVAQRLSGLAKPGEILVGEDTYRQAGGYFAFEKLESTKVKGKIEPLPVYRVVEERLKVGRIRGLATQGISSPLVGRNAEFVAIKGCVNRLLDGQGGILSVIGEAGLGKSRLMAEIRNQTDSCSLQWLEGRTLSYGQKISYWPFQEMLRQYSGITEDDSEIEAWEKLESRIIELFGTETGEILPYLASLMTLTVKGEYAEGVKYLDGEAMGRQVFLVSRRFFERLAQGQPLILVFEDLHWADESSTLLLEHLLPLITRAQILICGVSRPEPKTPAYRLREIAAKDFDRRYTEIRLGPLSQTQSTELMKNLVEIDNLPTRVREVILNKAEGNPFFLEEIMRSLIDRKAVVRDSISGRWRATSEIETITIPDTIQGVIMARVDRLDEELKQVLRTASVIGRSFLYRILRAIGHAIHELDQHLDDLQAMELIREKRKIPELEYIFKHALVQESTYESILLQKRRELHARVAQAIETLFSDRLEEFYSTLAHNYARAEAWEKAHEYLFKAGDQAGRIAADTEALNHYQQAMAAYTRAFGDKWNPFQRAVLERKMCEALFRRGEHAQAFEYFKGALAVLGRPFPASRNRIRLAILQAVLQQVGHRLLPILFLRNEKSPSPAVEEAAILYAASAWFFGVSDPESFLFIVLTNLNLCEKNGLDYMASQAHSAIGYACDIVGLFGLAGYYHHRGVSLADQTQNPDSIGRAYMLLMNHQFYLGEMDKALENGRLSAQNLREAGDLRAWACVSDWIGHALAYKGDFSHAIEHCQKYIRIGQEGGDKEIVGWGRTLEGCAEQRMGNLDDACVHLQQAIEVLETVPDYLVSMSAYAELGRCYLRKGKLSQALLALEKSQQLRKEKKQRGLHATRPCNGLAEAYLVAVEQSNQSDKQGWLKKAGSACRAALKQGKVFRPGLPEAMRLQGRYRWLRGYKAHAQRWWHRSLKLAEEMDVRYDLGLTHLEMGQRLKDRTHLEKAEAIFAEIGAEWDLGQTRKLLKLYGT